MAKKWKKNKEKKKVPRKKKRGGRGRRRGRVAPDNFLTSKRKKTSVRLAPPDNYFLVQERKCPYGRRVASDNYKCPCGFPLLAQACSLCLVFKELQALFHISTSKMLALAEASRKLPVWLRTLSGGGRLL